MSTQPRGDLKSTAPTSVSPNAMNPFGAKDLTVLAAMLSPVGPSAREALIATAPYRQSEFCEDLAEYFCAAPLATGVIDAAIAAEDCGTPIPNGTMGKAPYQGRMPGRSGKRGRAHRRLAPST